VETSCTPPRGRWVLDFDLIVFIELHHHLEVSVSEAQRRGKKSGEGYWPANNLGLGTQRPVALVLKGFKSVKNELQLPLTPITILAGRNSSGKSSMLQPLLMLKQTLDSGSDPGPLLMYGSLTHFTEPAQLLWHTRRGTSRPEFSFGYVDKEKTVIAQTYAVDKTTGLAIAHVDLRDDVTNVTLAPNQAVDIVALPAHLRKHLEETKQRIRDLLPGPTSSADIVYEVQRHRASLVLSATIQEQGPEGTRAMGPIWAFDPMEPLQKMASGLIYLPGLRGNPERDYKIRAVGETYPGAFQDYIASILANWQDSHDASLGRVEEMLQEIGIGGKVAVRRINAVARDIRIDLDSVADVGLGVSQVLPLLIALAVAEKKRNCVYVEQPEIHLHPKAQYALAAVLAKSAKAGARIIVETHSSILILGLLTAVADHTIERTSLGLNWFDQNPQKATTMVTAHVDAQGRVEQWPADFDETDFAAQRRYVDLSLFGGS